MRQIIWIPKIVAGTQIIRSGAGPINDFCFYLLRLSYERSLRIGRRLLSVLLGAFFVFLFGLFLAFQGFYEDELLQLGEPISQWTAYKRLILASSRNTGTRVHRPAKAYRRTKKVELD
jgi:hypothetical protein